MKRILTIAWVALLPVSAWAGEAQGPPSKEVAPRLTMSAAKNLPLLGTTVRPGQDFIHQRRPAAAYGNGQYLVVWQEGFNGLGGNSNIVALRLDEEGRPLDQRPIAVCTAEVVQEGPAVAFCAGRFLVAWSDFRNGTDYDVYAAFVEPDGRVTPQDGFLLAGGKGGQAHPAVAANGTDQFLAVWQGFTEDHFGIYAARVSATSLRTLDRGGFPAMDRGERPVVAWTGKNYAVCQKWYAALVGQDGKVETPVNQLWNSKTVLLPAVASAWGKAFLFFNTEPFQDPWGWGGNGAIIGVSLTPEGESPERGWASNVRDLSGAEADGRVKNCLDAARWRNHPGWPMGMRGALKGTHDGMWPSGALTAAFNGRSLLVVWPRAHWVDNRRLANRDLYLTRVLPDWGLVDRPPVRLVAGHLPVMAGAVGQEGGGGSTEEANPVLCAGALGKALLAYERVVPDGVTVEYRLLTESEDAEPPQLVYVTQQSDTEVILGFDEPIDAASASNAANYAIEGLAVKSAVFNADNRGLQREVVLATEPQTRGKAYALRVTGVRDRASRGNATTGEPVTFLSKPGTSQRTDFIAEWLLAGPFPRDVSRHPFDPAMLRPSPGDAVGAADLKWQAVKGQVLDLGEKFGETEGMVYAATYIFSDRPREALLRLDTNDHNRAWLNGKLVLDGITAATATRGFHDRTDEIPVTLPGGWTCLLVQVENRGGGWMMVGQVTDRTGQPIRDLTYQLEDPSR